MSNTNTLSPTGNLSKKGFAKMCDFIFAERPADGVEIVDLVSRAMTQAFNFSPTATSSQELSRRNYETRKTRLKALGETEYEKYVKPRRDRLRKKCPDLPSGK